MVAYADIFEREPELKKPFAAALTLHLVLTGALGGWSWWQGRARDTFGDPNTIPGAGSITTVDTIPMPPKRGPENRLANDTESQVPVKPKPEAKRVEPDDPDAVSLDRRKKKLNKKEKPKPLQARVYTPAPVYKPNQVFSNTGPAAATPMYSTPGGGGVGMGAGNPFGERGLGWYADLIRRAIGEKWRTQDVEARMTDGMVVVTFDIHRNGQVTNVRVAQRSANYTLDTSAMRAVQEASPLPGLPKEFPRNTASVEFQFQLKR
ncbi:MAG TPA: TonB family protein [Bryobacteraceae bacterium]|nr:TonB family protein [Bryobacteraceae bacterium]